MAMTALVASLSIGSRRTFAQELKGSDGGVPDAEPATDAGPAAVSPPQLIQSSEADYPEAARKEGLEATVQLTLTVDTQGRVTTAEVIAPAGHGFDEAAQAALLRFRFRP